MTALKAARSGHPDTRGGTLLLRLIACVQIILAFGLLPVVVLWYGLHEVPSWLRESIRPAVKTIRWGKSGPYLGVLW